MVEASSDGPGIRGLELDIRKYPEIRKVFETKEVLIIDDIRTEPILAPVLPYLEKTPFKSLALIPVIDQDEIVGTLVLRTARPGESFSERELRFLKAVAEASRPAILNAHLFEAVEERILNAPIETGEPGDDESVCHEALQDRAKVMLEQCYQLKEEVRRIKGLQEEIWKQHRPFRQQRKRKQIRIFSFRICSAPSPNAVSERARFRTFLPVTGRSPRLWSL